MSEPKYPDVQVQLSGEDGNGFFIIGRARRAARRAGIPAEEIDAYTKEAESGDYDNLLQTTIRWFSCS